LNRASAMDSALIVSVERCAYCDTTNGPFHRDHVVPRSRGGPDSPLNLVLACRSCNFEKRDQLPSEWLDVVPEHVAAIEARVAASVAGGIRAKRDSAKRWRERQNKPRDHRVRYERKAASSIIPGEILLHQRWPVCLEDDRRPCRLLSDFEVSICGDGWGAHCGKCVRFYGEKYTRELTRPRRLMHVLVQLRDGTLDISRERALILVAGAGGVSAEDYCDIASRFLCGDAIARSALNAAFPLLRLGMWEPTEAQAG